jgi:hypothetical protein
MHWGHGHATEEQRTLFSGNPHIMESWAHWFTFGGVQLC